MKYASLVVMTASLVLGACGGGGAAVSADSTSSGTGISTADYSGTFVGLCAENVDNILDARTDQLVNAIVTTEVNSISNDQASGTISYTWYGSSDTDCSQTALGTQKFSSVTHEYVGPIDQELSGKTVSAYRVKSSGAALGGLSAGTTITLNNVIYPGNYFQTPLEIYDLVYFQDGKLFLGSRASQVNSASYPTALDADRYMLKQ